MRMSSGPSIDVKLRVYDVSWTKETGASEQSFEIATKDGIYIFSLTSSGENQVTALKWMRSIRGLCMSLLSLSLSLSPTHSNDSSTQYTLTGTATLLDAKNDKNVIAESYLWKKSRGGLFSSDQCEEDDFDFVETKTR